MEFQRFERARMNTRQSFCGILDVPNNRSIQPCWSVGKNHLTCFEGKIKRCHSCSCLLGLDSLVYGMYVVFCDDRIKRSCWEICLGEMFNWRFHYTVDSVNTERYLYGNQPVSQFRQKKNDDDDDNDIL